MPAGELQPQHVDYPGLGHPTGGGSQRRRAGTVCRAPAETCSATRKQRRRTGAGRCCSFQWPGSLGQSRGGRAGAAARAAGGLPGALCWRLLGRRLPVGCARAQDQGATALACGKEHPMVLHTMARRVAARQSAGGPSVELASRRMRSAGVQACPPLQLPSVPPHSAEALLCRRGLDATQDGGAQLYCVVHSARLGASSLHGRGIFGSLC